MRYRFLVVALGMALVFGLPWVGIEPRCSGSEAPALRLGNPFPGQPDVVALEELQPMPADEVAKFYHGLEVFTLMSGPDQEVHRERAVLLQKHALGVAWKSGVLSGPLVGYTFIFRPVLRAGEAAGYFSLPTEEPEHEVGLGAARRKCLRKKDAVPPGPLCEVIGMTKNEGEGEGVCQQEGIRLLIDRVAGEVVYAEEFWRRLVE